MTFRKNNLFFVEQCFVDIIKICQQLGMVAAGRISIDGTKIKANAATHLSKNKQGYERWLETVQEDIKKILGEADAADAQEDELYGDNRGDELPALA